jgi:hypothetical protein
MSDIETTITQLAEESAQSYLDSNLESEVEDAVENYMNDNFQKDEYVTEEKMHHEISELKLEIEKLTNEIKEIKNATTNND